MRNVSITLSIQYSIFLNNYVKILAADAVDTFQLRPPPKTPTPAMLNYALIFNVVDARAEYLFASNQFLYSRGRYLVLILLMIDIKCTVW